MAETPSEREIVESVDLCRSDGSLNPDAVGWSRHPLHDCRLPGSWGRRKRWDYWCVTTPECVLAMTYADVDYLGVADVWFLDRSSSSVVNRSGAVPLGFGFSQPDTVAGRSINFSQFGFDMAIIEEEGGTRLLSSFKSGSQDFECDVLVSRPSGHESLSVVIPWSERRFQYTTKENTLPAKGEVTIGSTTYQVADDSWGCLDFGRGKWPYSTTWNWGSASGRQAGRSVGLQLGGKWTDGTGMTENALCIDGRLSKITERLDWEYETTAWTEPWRIATENSQEVDLVFTPDYEKSSRLELGLVSAEAHQCFGLYNGSVLSNDGELIEITDLFGWAEEARWRW